MKIIADENIPYVQEFFSRFGDVQALPGRTLKKHDLGGAEVLLVRSVTQVNAQLLDGTDIQFVGTCTIGTDHLDTRFLKQQKIAYASAPGCNAGGVLQYDFAALSLLVPDWRRKNLAVIGCGNVGGRIYRALQALSVNCVVFDPFKDRKDIPSLVDLNEALQADIILMHTPLTKDGDFPSYHMINAENLGLIQEGALLLNAGRGPAIDNIALLHRLERDESLKVVLDVWENEPWVNRSLLQRVHIATPHIAGYSFEGKLNGTRMICEALAKHLGQANETFYNDLHGLAQSIKGAECPLHCDSLNQMIAATYDILQDDQNMRKALLSVEEKDLGQVFDQLRKNYPQRREFEHFSLDVESAAHADEFCRIGFHCV